MSNILVVCLTLLVCSLFGHPIGPQHDKFMGIVITVAVIADAVRAVNALWVKVK